VLTLGIKCYNVEKGVKYEGSWKDNKPGGGNGTYFTERGEKISGLWEEGRIIPNDVEQPEFTTKDGETLVWPELEEDIRNKILEICLT
jgi:hypothetical protein